MRVSEFSISKTQRGPLHLRKTQLEGLRLGTRDPTDQIQCSAN